MRGFGLQIRQIDREGSLSPYAPIALAALGALATLGIAVWGHTLIYFFAFYSLGSLAAILILLSLHRIPSKSLPTLRLSLTVALACVLRIILALFGPKLSFDAHWYKDYAQFMMRGGVPYRDFYFPYPQGFAFLIWPLARAPQIADVVFRATFICSDIATLIVLVKIWERRAGSSAARFAGLAYAILPLPILETARIGHFETLICLCLALAAWALIENRAGIVAAAYAVATLLKGFPIVVAPAMLAGWRSRRQGLTMFLVVLALVAVTAMPIFPAIGDAITFWTGAQSEQGSGAPATAFAANSLVAIARNFPAFASVITFGQFCLLVFCSLLIAQALLIAWIPRLRTLNDNPTENWFAFPLRLIGAQRSRVLWIGLNSLVALGAAYAGIFLVMLLMGLFLVASPWTLSSLSYYWWTPPAITILRGLALMVVALGGLLGSTKAIRRPPLIALHLLMASALMYLIFLHANVNTWYLFPCLVLLLIVWPSRLVIAAIATVLIFYPAYNSSSFANIGLRGDLASTRNWQITSDPGPVSTRVRLAGSRVVDLHGSNYSALKIPSAAKPRYIIARYGSCMPAGHRAAIAKVGNVRIESDLTANYRVVAEVPGGTVSELYLPREGNCRPVAAISQQMRSHPRVVARHDHISVVAIAPRAAYGWLPMVSLHSKLVGYARPNRALRVKLRSDVDPTFHKQPFLVSLLVDGIDNAGRQVHGEALMRDYNDATKIGWITLRIPLNALPNVKKVTGITVIVGLVPIDSHVHSIELRGIGLVDESVWNQSIEYAVLAGGLVVVLTIAGVALIFLRRPDALAESPVSDA